MVKVASAKSGGDAGAKKKVKAEKTVPRTEAVELPRLLKKKAPAAAEKKQKSKAAKEEVAKPLETNIQMVDVDEAEEDDELLERASLFAELPAASNLQARFCRQCDKHASMFIPCSILMKLFGRRWTYLAQSALALTAAADKFFARCAINDKLLL